jgi:hypothetical protein
LVENDENIPFTSNFTEEDKYMLYYKHINLKKLSFSHKRIPTKKPPSSFEIREALRVLRRGMQHHSSNFELNYKHEHFINDLLMIQKK